MAGKKAMKHPYAVGSDVLLKTVTDYYVGKIVKIDKEEITLSDASWIANTGRWHVALATGFDQNAEIEPCVGLVVINRKALTAGMLWPHALPKGVQ